MTDLGAAHTAPSPASTRAGLATSFDHAKHGLTLNWTPTCLLIHGKPVVITCAEFHYFRVPDRERWQPLLASIRALGFNAVRLYIHWGYHSPAEGVYNFRGNRDIDYLLRLCTALQLFVIAAPGPYICAEVQAGGFPIWLVAKRHLRIRHLANPPVGFVKRWDQRFHHHAADYFRRILAILVPHERTNAPTGCIIALQVENELRERNILGIGGIDGEIRLLCEIARNEGSTVPIFHNDDAPIGSWSRGHPSRSLMRLGAKAGPPAYRTDCYGFDLYFTFPPGDKSGDPTSLQLGMVEACGLSSCVNVCGIGGAGVGGDDAVCLSCLYDKSIRHSPPPPLGWAGAGQMELAVDTLGARLQRFGGSAAHAPVVAAETQVGWINQWGRLRSYDDVYNFFGARFSSALQVSLLAQGVTIANHYMAYGGTNHGTVGDTEVYSSYDYSAFIREYGMLSVRGRELRLVLLFARSFADVGFANTVVAPASRSAKSHAMETIKATVPSALLAVRQAATGDVSPASTASGVVKPPTYAYVRNLKVNLLRFSLVVDNMVLPCLLGKCESAVVPLYHSLKDSNLSIFASSVPVICRAKFQGSEFWVLRTRESEVGRLVLNVDMSKAVGRQAITASWAVVSSCEDSPSAKTSGQVTATDQDPGAATPLLSAPLEELSLAAQGNFAHNGAPIGIKVSTEEVGRCFSFSFAVEKSVVVSISDMSEAGSSAPALRLLCLTDADASTFTAEVKGNDLYCPEEEGAVFSAAWGAREISFMPSGTLNVGFSKEDNSGMLYVIREKACGTPEQFQNASSAASAVLPGLFEYQVPEMALSSVLGQGIDNGNPLDRKFEMPIEGLVKRIVDWDDDVLWKRITYGNRDPLDHHMTSGHVAYRLRFRSSSRKGSIVVNARHSAVVWCNGMAVGGQVCFSHNVLSAGAMHAVDLHQAGKKRHDLTHAMRQNGPDANGMHEIIILVLSLGQSRSPFLLNDIRNKRGLLSGRLSRATKASNVSWEMAGVDVTRSDDAYGSSGLPMEDEMNTLGYDTGFEKTRSLDLKADSGLVYYRGSFKLPANAVVGGSATYPLRIKVVSGAHVRVMLWVNTLFLGRYVESLGPQSNFYIPEGLISQCKGNSIVMATYGPVDANLSIQILPWVVDRNSGNLDEENGQVYALRMANFELDSKKKV